MQLTENDINVATNGSEENDITTLNNDPPYTEGTALYGEGYWMNESDVSIHEVANDLYPIEYYQSDDDDDDNNNNENGYELTTAQKLQLAERANEIYRQQLKYMQDHLAAMRSLVQDKETIISNLILRYDLGVISTNKHDPMHYMDDIEMEEERNKALALAQRTVLENQELRDNITKLIDANQRIKHQLLALNDKVDIQTMTIDKFQTKEKEEFNDENGVNDQDIENILNEIEEKEKYIITDDTKEEKIDHICDLSGKINVNNMKHYKTNSCPLDTDMDKMDISARVNNALQIAVVDEEKKERKEVDWSQDIDKKTDNMQWHGLSNTAVSPLPFEEPEVLIHFEKLKVQDLEQELERVLHEREALLKFKINVDIIKKMFGDSLKKLIPFQLNDNALLRYGVLFDGYYRKEMKYQETFLMIPTAVTRVIGMYYPIFWEIR